jgi:hypothetical protein
MLWYRNRSVDSRLRTCIPREVPLSQATRRGLAWSDGRPRRPTIPWRHLASAATMPTPRDPSSRRTIHMDQPGPAPPRRCLGTTEMVWRSGPTPPNQYGMCAVPAPTRRHRFRGGRMSRPAVGRWLPCWKFLAGQPLARPRPMFSIGAVPLGGWNSAFFAPAPVVAWMGGGGRVVAVVPLGLAGVVLGYLILHHLNTVSYGWHWFSTNSPAGSA